MKYKRPRFKYWLDTVSLIAVMQYIAYRFLQSTMFDFVYSNIYKNVTCFFLVACACTRVVAFFVIKSKNQQALMKLKEVPRFILICASLFVFIIVGWKNDVKVIIFLPFIMINLMGIYAERILKWFVWVVGILLTATTLCSLTGAVRNLTYIDGKHINAAYGIINTTDYAAYITFLLLSIWCSHKQNNLKSTVVFAFFCVSITVGSFFLTKSRTGLFCGIILGIFIVWEYIERTIDNSNKKHSLGKRINNLSIASFPLASLAFVVLVFLYGKQNTFAIKLDSLFSQRLYVTWVQYQKYGIQPFGAVIYNLHGDGASLIHRWGSWYGYLDSAYAMLLIRYGWMLFIIIMGFWMWMTRRALQNDNNRIALAAIIISIHALMEARFLDSNYNVFLVMAFCGFREKEEKKEGILIKSQYYTEIIGRENKKINIIVAIIIGLAVSALYPQMISRMRTIISLKGWTIGVHAVKAFLMTLCVVLLTVALWKAVTFLCIKQYKPGICLVALVVVISLGIILIGENIIQIGITEQRERLTSEEQDVKIILNSTQKPVYVSDESEIYQRKYQSFDYLLFSPEELYRTKGTVITNKTSELMGVINAGGKYTQFSEWSGVYSFDPNVIEALSEKGYEWKDFFYSERTCDLYDLAIRNDLQIDDGKLLLQGKDKSISKGLEWDQYNGSYEVYCSLELRNKGKQEIICTLYVVGEAGEWIPWDRPVTIYDFSEGNVFSFVYPYYIIDTPKVSYQIIAEDDAEVYVKALSWRRVK